MRQQLVANFVRGAEQVVHSGFLSPHWFGFMAHNFAVLVVFALISLV